jgi:hypothetical protein
VLLCPLAPAAPGELLVVNDGNVLLVIWIITYTDNNLLIVQNNQKSDATE